MINYHNKIFRSVSNTNNGEAGNETIFEYQQHGRIVTAVYKGGAILNGQLMAIVDENGSLDMRYHHVNTKGQFMTGTCQSSPELLPNGKLRLYEKWKWTSGDGSEGDSILEEI
jgi:hypothetical protein